MVLRQTHSVHTRYTFTPRTNVKQFLLYFINYSIPAAGKRQYRTRTHGASGFIVFEGNQ